MFGDEYSITTFLPAPDEFVPYSGLPDGASYVSLCTCVSTARISDGVLSMKCKNALSCVIDSTKSSAWNYATVPSKKNERRAFVVIIISKAVERNMCCTHLVNTVFASTSTLPGRRKWGRAIVKLTPFLP